MVNVRTRHWHWSESSASPLRFRRCPGKRTSLLCWSSEAIFWTDTKPRMLSFDPMEKCSTWSLTIRSRSALSARRHRIVRIVYSIGPIRVSRKRSPTSKEWPTIEWMERISSFKKPFLRPLSRRNSNRMSSKSRLFEKRRLSDWLNRVWSIASSIRPIKVSKVSNSSFITKRANRFFSACAKRISVPVDWTVTENRTISAMDDWLFSRNARAHRQVWPRCSTLLYRLSSRLWLDRCSWEPLGMLPLPRSVTFLDYSAVSINRQTSPHSIAVSSQEDSQLWIGIIEEIETLPFFRVSSPTKTDLFDTPRRDEWMCEVQYCNIEGVAWSNGNQVILVSDQAKTDQPTVCSRKDQHIHYFTLSK